MLKSQNVNTYILLLFDLVSNGIFTERKIFGICDIWYLWLRLHDKIIDEWGGWLGAPFFVIITSIMLVIIIIFMVLPNNNIIDTENDYKVW